MSDRIKILNNNFKALGSTSKAFDIEKTEELMREYTLSFSIVNNDTVFRYISENNIFLYNGQYFDIAGIDGDSGNNNITQVTAEHISYRLADYTLPNGYSFVGTVREIAVDILNEAKTVSEEPASDIFSIGETADLGTVSFSLRDAKNVTAREALIAMSELGVEIAFDNFTVNIPKRRGTNSGITFTYGVNLTGVHRTWQKGNGWSYDIDIADLQKTIGGESYRFVLGDDIVVNDTLSGIVVNSRIISYTECDDPTKNHVTVGVFVRDNASLTIETDRIANTANETANAAKDKANTSLQQGEKYSNVSITHKDGFVASNKAGTQRVVMNGDDCFIVQVLQNGKWVTVNSLEAFGLLVDRLTSKEAKDDFYIKVGKTSTGRYGLTFYLNNNAGLTISSRENNATGVLFDVLTQFSIQAINGVTLKASANDAYIDLIARNVSLITGNIFVHDTDEGKTGTGFTETVKFVTKDEDDNNCVRTFNIIQGILTK
ncbi:MAG: phage tail protein [Clostridia bacterium]|nr:phage tail protein [Clostridia bacterium]MBR4117198.1 phage tail protein [Clostridia bacterium]